MEETDVETIIQRARESFPGATPRIITDNGPQFIAKDFKEFIRIAGMTHVKTSPYYPQSNGKIERWHKTLKGECIRVQVPLSLDDARRIVTDYVAHYNTVRLHSAIGYVTPKDKLHGRDKEIFAARDRKLAEARERRKQHAPGPARAACRHAADCSAPPSTSPPSGPPSPWPPSCNCSASRPRSQPRRPATRPCPLHGSTSGTSRCFSANLDDQTFHCFKCGRSGNALDLWAAGHTANRLRRRHRSVPTPGHPAATTGAAAAPEQGRGTRSSGIGYLYNDLSTAKTVTLYPLTQTERSSRSG